MFLTTDLYQAAAIIADSGVDFNRIEQVDSFKALIWDDESLIAESLARWKSNTLLVKARKFKCVHIAIRHELQINKGAPLE